MIHDASTFGYFTHLKSSPKALLLSTRMAPVRNRRSRQPNFCSRYAPIVVFRISDCDGTSGTATPDTVSMPAPGKPVPPNVLVLDSLRNSCPPTDVADVSVFVRSKRPVPA